MPLFELGKVYKFKVGVKGRTVDATVIATGGGNTTFKTEGKLICFSDTEAAKRLNG